jgi:hypothetical protein
VFSLSFCWFLCWTNKIFSISMCLGFWNVTNPWKNEWRKSTNLSISFVVVLCEFLMILNEKLSILTISMLSQIHKDTKWSWSSVLDGSWVDCTSNIQ